jgi:DNA mismatch endonuclease, patch repair protein
MGDKVTPEQRSAIMARVRSSDTSPEIAVRRTLHKMGFRFRLHRRDLPGSPDIVLPRHRAAIFVHGCFWHSHEGCSRARLPASNVDYWKPKLERNRLRDDQALLTLRDLGWRAYVIWECEARASADLQGRLRKLLVDPVHEG